MEIGFNRIAESVESLRLHRESLAREFSSSERPYLICQTPGGTSLWSDANSPERCFELNMRYIGESLAIPSDHIPCLEPWFGTGIYANMYGCPYFWRSGEAPAVRYRAHSLDELPGLRRPQWKDGEIARLAMDTIRYFKTKTGNAIPIVMTDTQSANDTATMIVEATEILIGCLTEPELIMNFLRDINRLILEFSTAQAEIIGDALARPGHGIFSSVGWPGIGVSDDNLAVVSPAVAETINLPLDEELGRAMGGVAIHSCGPWAKVMARLRQGVPSCTMIECAVESSADPNPNKPEDVRNALRGTGITLAVRMTGETEKMIEVVKRLLDPDLKVIIHPEFVDIPTAERNYYELDALLSGYYGSTAKEKGKASQNV